MLEAHAIAPLIWIPLINDCLGVVCVLTIIFIVITFFSWIIFSNCYNAFKKKGGKASDIDQPV